MPPKLSQLGTWSLIAFIGVLILPNLVWIWVSPGPVPLLSGLIIQPALLLMTCALIGGRIWLFAVLLSPFALLVPAETNYIAAYGRPTDADVLASIFATNASETLEYFGPRFWAVACATLACLVVALLTAWLAKKADLRWTHRSRQWFLISAIALPVATWLTGFARSSGDFSARVQMGSALISDLGRPLAPGFPFGVITRATDFYSQWRAMYSSVEALKKFRFHAKREVSTTTRQVYVLALGESSRRDHWQLFGYARPTNPELSGVANLVPIPDMVTSRTVSTAAIPLVLTRKPMTEEGAWNEASILRAMQEAGFHTWWISNQKPLGKFDSPVSIYALEAEHIEFLNHSSSESAPSYDDVLVRPLLDVLEQESGDLFIVLHMMGSHLSYDLRYPSGFKLFRPTYSDPEDEVVAGERIRNSYDNSILYSDHVLARVIEALRDSGSIAALFFESDHGETLPTPTCSMSGHGIGSKYDFQVPSLFWHSDSYAKEFPDRVAAISANAARPVLSANTFESLIDAAGVEFPGHDPTWSLFSGEWKYHQRMVTTTSSATDFDKAEFATVCDVVMPPRIAPKREK